MAENDGNSLKKSLLGWATGALKKIESAIDEAAATPAAAPPRAAQTGELTPPGSGRLSGAQALPGQRAGSTADLKKPASSPLPGSGQLGKSDGLSLSGPLPTAAPKAPAAPPEPTKSPEEQAEESKKRLKLILAYMKDPESDPVFKNKPLMYRILTEERSFQQAQIVSLGDELEKLPPPASAMGLSEEEAEADPLYAGLEDRRKALQDKLHVCQTRQTQLFTLMKKLTGVKGKTGGTGFLAAAKQDEAPPTNS